MEMESKNAVGESGAGAGAGTGGVEGSAAVVDAMARLSKTVHCPVCMDFFSAPVTLPCSHTYCNECIQEVVKNSTSNPLCPLCQQSFTKKSIGTVCTSLQPVIASIRKFVDCYEGKSPSEVEEVSDPSLRVDKKFRMARPDFKAGDLVHVAPRLWPGINKPGGTAWIQAVVEPNETSTTTSVAEVEEVCYDCKYVLGGGVDYLVPASFIRVANDLNDERESRSRRPRRAQGNANTESRDTHRRGVAKKRITNVGEKKVAGNTKSERERSDGKRGESNGSSCDIDRDDGSIMQPPLCKDTSVSAPLGFLCSTLSVEELDEVKKFCDRFPPARILDAFSDAVTHVVVRVDRKGKGKNQVRLLRNRTMKYLQGVLGHKWIVSHAWLVECVKIGKVIDETPFEVTRDSKADEKSFGPKWSRESANGAIDGDVVGLFDTGCRYIFAGPFCHPGPTIDNLSFLLKAGGGRVVDNMAAMVTYINASLDGGLRVRRKNPAPMDEVTLVVVSNAEAANDFCRQLYMSVSDIRKECAYDFGDFVDHLNWFVGVVLSDWIFNCISNYTFENPLRTSRFRVDLDRNVNWQISS